MALEVLENDRRIENLIATNIISKLSSTWINARKMHIKGI